MIYDRKNKKYYDYKESKIVIFLYKNVLGRFFLKIVTQKWLTNLAAWYMRTPLSRRKIKKFIKKNNINMNEYVEDNYANFDAFFTRHIKKDCRPLISDKKVLIAPADAKVSAYKIDENTHLHIKNSCYSIEELIQNQEIAQKYDGGTCLVFRLCVDDYHHYAFIDDGAVIKTTKIDGRLHTVRPIAQEHCKVFSENKRECSLLKTDHFGEMMQIEVGALLVGRICNLDVHFFNRGDEKGYFRFGGSTIILLFEKDKVVIDSDILKNTRQGIETKVQMFEQVGRSKEDV